MTFGGQQIWARIQASLLTVASWVIAMITGQTFGDAYYVAITVQNTFHILFPSVLANRLLFYYHLLPVYRRN